MDLKKNLSNTTNSLSSPRFLFYAVVIRMISLWEILTASLETEAFLIVSDTNNNFSFMVTHLWSLLPPLTTLGRCATMGDHST